MEKFYNKIYKILLIQSIELIMFLDIVPAGQRWDPKYFSKNEKVILNTQIK